jgi:hypothetical protein
VVQRQLAADEAQFLGEIGPRAGGVELQLVAHRAAEHLIDRLLRSLPSRSHSARSTPEMAFTTRPLRP